MEEEFLSRLPLASMPPNLGGNPEANLKSISHRCHPIQVAFVWALTEETIDLPLGCLQGGPSEIDTKNVLRFCPGKMRVCRLEAAKWRRGV